MEAVYNCCIFCGEILPPPSERGEGEHIIPKLIYGSVKIKDVCESCNSKLGAEVDHLILEDPRVIDAIITLDIEELKDKVVQRGTTTGYDTVDGHEIEYRLKNSKYRMILRQIEPDGIEHDEKDALSVLIGMAKKRRHPAFSEEEAVHYVKNILWKDYEKLEPGREIDAKPIGRRIVKRQAIIQKTSLKQSPKAAHRLIAKIIYEICWYVLEPETLDYMKDDINYYGAFAYGEREEEEWRIMTRPQRGKLEPDYYHTIQIHYSPALIAIDIDLFQSVNFRGIIRPSKRIPLPKFDHREINGFGIFMDFSPDREKSKGYAVRYEGEDGWIQYACPNL